MTQQKVTLDQFSPQELYQLRQGFQSQINTLNQSLNQFRYAMDRYQEGRRAIKAAQDCKNNQQLMIPLSNALYIQGTLDNLNDRVYLIQYGAGYFVERNAKEAMDFYERKVKLIKGKMEQLQTLISQKKEGLRQIQMRLMMMVQQQQQQQQPVK